MGPRHTSIETNHSANRDQAGILKQMAFQKRLQLVIKFSSDITSLFKAYSCSDLKGSEPILLVILKKNYTSY